MLRAWAVLVLVVALVVVFTSSGVRAEGPVGGIAWQENLTQVLEEAKASKRPVFIAINSMMAEGEGVEVASKLLREKVYPDPKIVEQSKAFHCVLLREPINSEDGGELRVRFEIEGLIVTPQHLFVHADGTLIERKQYWEFGEVASSVQALSAMLTRALKAHEVCQKLPARAEDPASRTAWIQAALALVSTGPDVELRRAAARALAEADREGDCLAALQGVLLAAKDMTKEEVPLYLDVVRHLGRPQLAVELTGLCALLEAKDAALRSHAAVSLEYVGSPKALEPLLKRQAKEKDETVRSNLLRAVGRCGAGDPAVRKTLLREALAKSDLAAAGALIGLAYFEGDAEVARGLEKTLKGNEEALRRVATLWTLVQVGDAKTAEVLRAQLDSTAKVLPSFRLLEAAVACLAGQGEGRKGELDQALRWALSERLGGEDPARAGRGASKFQPKGDFFARSE